MSISVLILTLNEEINLPACLESVSWCDDVVVFDSYSSDQTVAFAEAAGARVIQRAFDNYGDQRNAALDVPYKNKWLLMVDADERVTPELRQEMHIRISKGNPGISLYRMRRKDMFMGRWIRHSSGYPTWFGRLMKVGHVRIERSINEEYHTDGEIDFLQEHLIHYPFNKGFSSWLEKHNRYSSMEADLFEKGDATDGKVSNIFCKDPVIRRKAIKSIVYRLPGRPLLIFLGLYILRGGFLEGRAGFTYCVLKSFYEFMINCKVAENRLRRKNISL